MNLSRERGEEFQLVLTRFRIVHVAATMQGTATAGSVVAALQRLQGQHLDAICIIRGGGSPVDLAWLDHESIARAVANSPMPVWVGIGHEIDVGVLDHVAHTSHKTPTAVAEALVGRIRDLDVRLVAAAERLSEATLRVLDLADRDLRIKENGLRQGARKHAGLHDERFQRYVSRIETVLTQRTASLEGRLSTAVTLLEDRTSGAIQNAPDKLERSQIGLTNGSRKHVALFSERLSGRTERFRSTAGTITGRRVGMLQAASKRLQHGAESLRNRSATALSNRQARLDVGFRASQENAFRDLQWKARTLSGVLKVFDRESERLDELKKRVIALSPESLLERGYSIVRTADGRIVRSVADVRPGQKIVTQMRDGDVTGIVERIQEQANGQ